MINENALATAPWAPEARAACASRKSRAISGASHIRTSARPRGADGSEGGAQKLVSSAAAARGASHSESAASAPAAP